MKKMTQLLSGAFVLGLTQLSFAGANCGSGACDKSATATTVAVKDKAACATACDKSATATTVAVKDKAACATACDKGALAAVAEGHERVQYVISGMTCESKSVVKSSLQKIEGVSVLKVCSKSGTAVVDFDASKASKSDVASAINQGEIAVAAERITVPVSGMTCVSCTGKVTKALNAIDGLVVQKVCHKSGKAVVDMDTNKSSRAAVVKAIVDNGYKTS